MKLPKHLGGHFKRTHIDEGLLLFAKNNLNIKSMLDIGCGIGEQVELGNRMGINSIGVDGDFTIKRKNEDWFLTHDFTKGKLNLINKFDMIWCCEFVEHVQDKYLDNYMTLMTSGKYIFLTHAKPNKPGHHHVNCQNPEYWINIFNKYYFSFNKELTILSKQYSTMKREFWKNSGMIFTNLK